tara:strand:- start:364 stop:645 length:282 start_codon:yes stop_codon:yes gene_type:complete
LEEDITDTRLKDDAMIPPRLRAGFDHTLSIQIITPYEIWINRIPEREINLSFKNRTTACRIWNDSFSSKSRERRHAERLYYECRESWESYSKK